MSRATSKFGDFSVHNEWQPHKSGEFLFKQAKKDRKKQGELRKTKDGKVVFWIEKRTEELVYCKDSWAIDRSILSLLRCLGTPDVAIHVSNGDIYRIGFADLDARKYSKTEPKLIGKWFVDFEHFAYEQGEPESIEKAMMVGKWK